LAVEEFGGTAFAAGLTHSVERSIEFNAYVGQEIERAREEGRPAVLTYEFRNLLDPEVAAEVQESIADVKAAETGDDDLYPAFRDRLRLAESLGAPDPGLAGDRTVWDLFADRPALEAEFEGILNEVAAEIMAEIEKQESGEPAPDDQPSP
jgi:hypothetical protein